MQGERLVLVFYSMSDYISGDSMTLIFWNTTNLAASSCRAWLTYQSVFVDVLIIATEVILTLRRKPDFTL